MLTAAMVARVGGGERGGGRVVRIVLGEAGNVVLLGDKERADLDVGALILVGELDGGVELGEFNRGRAVAQPGDAWIYRVRDMQGSKDMSV